MKGRDATSREIVASPARRRGPTVDPAASLEAEQSALPVARALAILPERQRVAIVLTYYEELTNAEASEVMGTTVSGVEALLVRARRRLRRALDGVEE